MDDSGKAAAQALDTRVLYEQIALMCRLTTSPLAATVLVGGMLAWLVVDDYGRVLTMTWYLVLLLVTFVRWRVARAFLRLPPVPPSVRRWRFVMLALAATAGAVWSVPGSFLLPLDADREIAVSVIFIGATASGLGSQAPVRNAYASLLIPFILPFILTQLLRDDARLIVGLAFVLYIPVMLVIANRQTAAIVRQIRLSIENETLVDELRRERDRANVANRELQERIDQQQLSAQRIRALNHDLERQAADLRVANNDLEGFSYSVSHDLRGPLRAIDGFSRLLEDDKLLVDDARSRHYIGRIRDNIARMSALIDDLLAFASCGRQTLEAARLDMQMLARSAADEARTARIVKVAPVISIESLPAAVGDPRLLFQVWINLLDNAVKYTSKVAAPAITVAGREDGGRLVYEVSDNGVGFDSRYSSSLFGVFQRLHGAREYPGTGVGLAIVQRIVTRHGGRVWARSELGKGATFGFDLPMAPDSAQVDKPEMSVSS
ncbi:MAG: ATP-binding protein [Steroidobacteraceae bacterium]